MKLIDSGGAHVNLDQEGDPYFHLDNTVYYLNDFIEIRQVMGIKGDGVTHISNTSMMVIDMDQANEYVDYRIYTNA